MLTTLQLLGMKHTGKSSVGRLWAQRRGWDFYDLDHVLESQFGGGRTSREIFLEEGREGFQHRETLAANQLAGRLARGRAVLAWGGGTVTNPEAVDILRFLGTMVVLKDQCEVLYERILRSGLPAFLSPDHPWEDFQKVYQERSLLLEAVTPHALDLTGTGLDEAVERLQTLWNQIAQSEKS